MTWYGGRLFRVIETSGASQTTPDTIFRYHQKGDMLTGEYSGGGVQFGQIIGLVDARGHISMRYQHLTDDSILMTGKCRSRPEELPSGKLRLHERWQWTCGDNSKGTSILEEM